MRALVLCMTLFLLCALPALAADVLIVQSSHAPAYGEALRGFRTGFAGSSYTIVLAEYADVDVVRLVKEERPRLVLAVGDTALAACRKVRNVPVVSLMSLSLTMAKPDGIGGVGVVPSPERFLNLFKGIGAKRIGVIHDPDRSGAYFRLARQAARKRGMELVGGEVRQPGETVARLAQLKGRVDLLWMLPDTTAVTAESLEAYFRFSLEQRVPLITFSGQYLEKGAFAAIEADRFDMGRLVGEQVRQLLDRRETPAVLYARKVRLSTNELVSKKLGIATSNLDLAFRTTGE